MPTLLKKDLEGDYKLLLSWRYDVVEFLGLPSLKDNRPLTLEEIYVPLAFTWARADSASRVYLPEALETSRHLVVLGDPGCGKSTLVKLITYSFGRSEPTPLSHRFGSLLPVPIVLRDYHIRHWKTKEDMLSDFIGKLDQEIRDRVTVEWLLDAMREGRGFLLLDGLDEVGSRDDRLHLRTEIVRPLLSEMPDSYAILTSRVVGYDEVPFEGFIDLEKYGLEREGVRTARPSLRRCYVAPFNDDEVEQFIARWYAAREPDSERRRQEAESLRRALKQSDRIKRLAGNPALLTLMALVHRVTAQLPSGRVKLYDKIVEAYLETIQIYRKLGQYPASLDQMKRWLARVGWEMQSRRTGDPEGELLVSRSDVMEWLSQSIAVDRGSAAEEADQFLDYVAKRSGLLIERSPDQFSFVHLTFQEYFAAFYLRGKVGRFGELAKTSAELATQAYWRETLGVLFELLAEFPGTGDDLIDELAKSAVGDVSKRSSTAELFAALILDEQSGLSLEKKAHALEFTLSVVSERHSESVLKSLQQTLQGDLGDHISAWIESQLVMATPDQLGRDFFLIGNQLIQDWSDRLNKWVADRGSLGWSAGHVSDLVVIAGESPKICEWAVSSLPLEAWFAAYQLFRDSSMAELRLPVLLLIQNPSARTRLLIQLALASALTDSLAIREFVRSVSAGQSLNDEQMAEPETAGAQNLVSWLLNLDMARIAALWRAVVGAGPRIEAKALASDSVYLPVKAKFPSRTARGFLSSMSQPVADALARAVSEYGERADAIGPIELLDTAEAIFFSPDVSKRELNSVVARLRKLMNDGDDLTRVLGVSALLLLGRGTPELCKQRNELLEKGLKVSNRFTFPSDVRDETRKDDFQRELPAILRFAFRCERVEQWMAPANFDPANFESRYFLSTPRDFFAVAAEVLDPKNETGLAKWRPQN